MLHVLDRGTWVFILTVVKNAAVVLIATAFRFRRAGQEHAADGHHQRPDSQLRAEDYRAWWQVLLRLRVGVLLRVLHLHAHYRTRRHHASLQHLLSA